MSRMDLEAFHGHPHDTLFRRRFGRKELLAEFLDHALPAEVVGLLDKDTLEMDPNSYVDERHRGHYSDVAASVRAAGREVRVYLLLEHKSYDAPMAMLQLLRYMQLTWQEEADSRPGSRVPLTPIIPILFHHGRDKNPSHRFSDLFGGGLPEELRGYQPEFVSALYNLTAIPDEKLTGSAELRSTLSALKYSRSRMERVLKTLASILKEFGLDPETEPWIQDILVYIYYVSEMKPEDLQAAYQEQLESPELKEAFMSTAQMLIQEGQEKGLARGMAQGMEKGLFSAKREDARRMLNKGYPLGDVMDITGLSEAELQKIRKGEL